MGLEAAGMTAILLLNARTPPVVMGLLVDTFRFIEVKN